MNDQAVPGDVGGYLFEFRGKRPLRETAKWVTGVGLAGAGVAIAVIGTASGSYSSMPLGIAVAVLGLIVLILYLVTRSKTGRVSALSRAGKHIRNARKVTPKESLASELAVLANLYSQGALTAEEFVAAKRRILDM